jgi:hypothetical protein
VARGDGAQAQIARGALAQRGDRVRGGAQRRQHAAGAFGHELAAAGGAHAPGVALEQLYFQQILDVSQGVGGGRLAQADVAGGLLDAAQVGDAGEQLQMAQAALGQQAGQQGWRERRPWRASLSYSKLEYIHALKYLK